MTDGKEETVNGQVIAFLIGLSESFDHMGTLHAILAIESERIMLEKHFNLLVLHDPFLHHVTGTQERFAHNHIDFLAELGKVDGFLAGSVTASHHGHGLLTIEEPVAGGTGRNAHSVVFLLVVETKILRTGTRGDDDRVGLHLFATVGGKYIGTLGEIGFHDDAVSDVGTEPFCLLTQLHHHLVAIHTFRIARKVLHDGGLCELSTHLQTAVEHRVQIGTPRINGCSISGRATADD